MNNNKSVANELKSLNILMCQYVIKNLKKIDCENMSPIQVEILKYVYLSKNKVYQRDLENVFKLRRSTISGILKTMEKNNLIKRIDRKDGYPVKGIILTDNAKNKYELIVKNFKLFNKNIEKDISNEELKTFFNGINKIKMNINK